MPPCTTPNGWWWDSLSDMLARTRSPLSSWILKSDERGISSIIAPEGMSSTMGSVTSLTLRQFCGEALDGRHDRLGPLEVRAVAARHDEALRRARHAGLDAVELVERSVRVVGALDEQQRGVHALGLGLERPRPEGGVQPHVAPA